MASLRVNDALEACATFPSRADWRLLSRVRKPKHYEVTDARDILDVLATRGIHDSDLVRELRE